MIIIVGGGISGLAAAYELSQRRRALSSARSRVDALGGLIRTEQCDGFTIDAGADSLLRRSPPLSSSASSWGSRPLQEIDDPALGVRAGDGTPFPLPSPSVLGIPPTLPRRGSYELLPLVARLRCCSSRSIRRADDGRRSVASFFRRRFGAATVISSRSRCSAAFTPATSSSSRCARCFRVCWPRRRTAASCARSSRVP